MDAGADPNRTSTRRGEQVLKVGRYEVVRELGKGAMGIVYLAKDPLIGRLVALKTIRPAQHADDDETKEFQQRFLREAQAAGILNHPAIVTVHDIGQDDSSGMMFIAMEYVEGSNMKEVLSQGRPLTFEQVGDIIPQIPDGYEDVVARCLAKDPTKRYQRARDLALHLRAVVRGERPMHAEPMQAEETVVTRHNDKIPTVEIPFPEAETSDQSLGT